MHGRTMLTTHHGRGLRLFLAAVITATTVGAVVAIPSPAHAAVTLVEGSAYGSFGTVSLFGSPWIWRGPEGFPECGGGATLACTASVSLPPSGAARTASDPGGDGVTFIFGPAIIFSSGLQQVSTQATLGLGGSVTSTASVQNINKSTEEVFTASSAISGCTATESGVEPTTTINSGVVRTSLGNPEIEGDEVYTPVPSEPLPNTVIPGQIEDLGESFNYIFNEQVTHPDGSATVYAAHLQLLGPVVVGDIYIAKSTCGATHRVARTDFDKDGDTDVSVFRPAGFWFVNGSPTVHFGAVGDIPVPGDYDNDDRLDVAAFRASSGVWILQDGALVGFGTAGDIPVPADYDGDGDTDIAVFRPSSGVWIVNGGPAVAWGTSGDIPVPADYDGDGDTDMAVFRPSTGAWFVHGGLTTGWGTSGDIPVPADYDGDADADVAVFRPSTGTWFVQGGTTLAWGTSGDIPVPGNYDGGADAEFAVFRPSTGVWFVYGGLTVAFGTSSDVPLPLPDAIRRFFFPPL